MFRSILVLMSALLLASIVNCQTEDNVILKNGLAIKLKRSQSAGIISPNPVIASMETGKWNIPSEDEKVFSNNQLAGTWRKIDTDDKGWFKSDSLVNAYVYCEYKSAKDEIVIVEAMGNEMVYVNGVPRSGNPYSYQDDYDEWAPRFDYSLIPIQLKKGINEFLFVCNRGLLKVKLHPSKNGLIFNEKDLTIPDLIVNEAADTYGAIPIINATTNSYRDLFIKTWVDKSKPEYYSVNEISPLAILKIPFRIKLPVIADTGKIKLNIELVQNKNTKEDVLSSSTVELNVLEQGNKHKETFISEIDGSVQYYAVTPPVNLKNKSALFLSLHGAGVEAIGQARAYDHKNWGYVVAPTNRRPYGYNWENWGRLDALEVMNIVKRKFNIDENRVYLTGHSMGGHGTWHLGINYSDQFAAIGPSAGWISIWSYRIRSMSDSSNIKKMLIRSAKQSDTYAFATNLKQNGIYIIHGDADDNVPIQQAESMISELSKFHKDYDYHIQRGAGHWWDLSEQDGADCVDWAPMFDFFAHHKVAGKNEIKMIDFVTANPAISSKNYWIEIINQIKQQELSKINICLESGLRKFTGTTNNIELLSIDATMLSDERPVSIELDKQLIHSINISADKKIYLKKDKDKWQLTDKPSEENKYPARCGVFRESLNYRPVFVYGTHGSSKENKWAFEKARYDAEKIWYRGNSSIEIIEDNEFDPEKYKNRSVILFGNSKTNSAWKILFKDSPIQINKNKIKVGDREYAGDDYACLLVRPRADSKIASVAAVSGTGIEGMRLVNLAHYFEQYTSFPDVLIFNSDILHSDEAGVKFTGYFGNDWSLEKGEFVTQ